MKVVHLFSGGLDSSVALYDLVSKDYEVAALGVHYGQRHQKEVEHAKRICESIGVQYLMADLSALSQVLTGNSQTDAAIDVPEGHYTDENMKLTVVPNRNMIMLSVAIGWAVSMKFDAVCYAAHTGDHTIYPDCRPEFADAVDKCAQLCDWHPVKVLRPFIHFNKTKIVELGSKLDVPFEKTWSCYKGRDEHCGKCGTCVERKEAFQNAGVKDPTKYEDL